MTTIFEEINKLKAALHEAETPENEVEIEGALGHLQVIRQYAESMEKQLQDVRTRYRKMLRARENLRSNRCPDTL